MSFKVFVKKVTPGFIIRTLQNVGVVRSYIPLPGKVGLGDLNRTSPLSKVFGYDRGGPVDRYYIENFLQNLNCFSLLKLFLKSSPMEILVFLLKTQHLPTTACMVQLFLKIYKNSD